MVVITLRMSDGVVGKLLTKDGPVTITVNRINFGHGGKPDGVRLAFDLPDSVELQRVVKATGEVIGACGSQSLSLPSSLSDGVAEATLACTGADSSAPLPRTDAGETPLVKLGQGDFTRATSGRDVARDSALGGLINAIA